MKVVQINAVYELSSTGRTCKEMHEYFMVHGIDSYKFYSVRNIDSDKYDLIGSDFDHKLHGLWSRLFGKQACFSYYHTRKLIRKLDSIQPDVVILRNFHSNYIHFPLLARYLAKNNIATVVVLHDCWFFTGHCCHYTEIDCQRWQKECHHCPLIRTNNKSLFFDNSRSIFRNKRHLFGQISRLAIVGVSDWITNEGQKSPIFEQAVKFERIYNWINLKVFYPREVSDLRMKLGLSDSDFIALGVSMLWDYKKGFEIYLEVAKILPEIKIVMIGNVPDVFLPANIIVVLPTSSTDELAQYYSMADVLFNFSIQETFGKVSAEALACGTPLIVNNATANPELPGNCGISVEGNNVQQVIDALSLIRAKGKDYYSLSCVKRANDLFDKDRNIEQYIKLFEDLIRKIK